MDRSRLIIWRSGDLRFLPLLMVLVTVLATAVVVFYVAFTVVRVDGESMAPALHDEYKVLLTRRYANPEAGDIVSFTTPRVTGPMIKRVVAVPGDHVEVDGDVVYVNGELSEVAATAFVGTGTGPRAELTVPQGSVYVLGDNRPEALDSRHFGPVPLEGIQGKVVGIIFPLSRVGALD